MRMTNLKTALAAAVLLAAPAAFANGTGYSGTQDSSGYGTQPSGSGYSGSQTGSDYGTKQSGSQQSGTSYSGTQPTQSGSTMGQQTGSKSAAGQMQSGVYGVIQHVDSAKNQLTLIVPADTSTTFRQIGNAAELTREADMVSLRVKVDPGTTVDRNGQKASLSSLKMGDNVRVSFDPSNSKIDRIEATPLSQGGSTSCPQMQGGQGAGMNQP